jgi:hypothetical protein
MNNSLLLPGLGFQQPRAWRLGTGRGFRKVLYPAAAAAAAAGSAWGVARRCRWRERLGPGRGGARAARRLQRYCEQLCLFVVIPKFN